MRRSFAHSLKRRQGHPVVRLNVQSPPSVSESRKTFEMPLEQFYGPSRTTSKEMGVLLGTIGKKVRSHYEAVINGDLERGKRYYRDLYSISSATLREAFWMEVDNATVYAPRGLIVSDDGSLLMEAMFDNTLEICRKDLRQGHREAHGIEPRVLSLLAPFSDTHNYAHWLMDSMVKLAPFKTPFDFCVLIPPGSPRFVRDSLSVAGFQAEQIIEAVEGPNRCSRLIVSRVQDRTGEPRTSALHLLREMLLRAAPSTPASKRERLYIGRKAGTRRIVNEDELEPILLEFGIRRVESERLSFSEQVDLFSKAEFILGAHGAGMLNSIFAPEGAIVMEIYNEKKWDPPCRKICSQLGLFHWHMWGRNVGNNWDTFVDPERLREAIRASVAFHRSAESIGGIDSL